MTRLGIILRVILPIAATVGVIAMTCAPAESHNNPTSAQITASLPRPTTTYIPTGKKIAANWTTVQIHSGDSLTKIFSKYNINSKDILALDKPAKNLLSKLRPGQTISWIASNNHIQWIRYHPQSTQTLLVHRNSHNKLQSSLKITPMVYNLDYQHLTIDSSLSGAIRTAHLTNNMTADIKHMFAGSIDLNRNLQPGDTIDLLFEEYYLNGVRHHMGHVVAATLAHKGREKTAIRYQPLHKKSSSFYNTNGKSVDPLFLSYPLHFKRISSPFSMHRFDPVKHRIAPHLGVDFAAKTGTPVRSIGNGKVNFVGWSKGFGNTIKIDYGRGRMALYGHLSRFSRGIKRKKLVHKGEVIGFVGQTGWATGPHLHFGFYLHRKAINWLSYKQPRAPAIKHKDLPRFNRYRQQLLAELTLYRNVQLAKNTSAKSESTST